MSRRIRRAARRRALGYVGDRAFGTLREERALTTFVSNGRGNTMRGRHIAWSLAILLAAAAPCLAHHGVAPHYDATKRVTLEGVVAKFEFINPHSFLYVDVADAAGKVETWSCEMASRTVLSRNGLKPESFATGAKIKIDGDAARHKATGCQVRTAYFADGSVLRDTSLYGPTRATAAEIPADAQSIVGVWTMKRFLAPRSFGTLTPAGERARAAFDPIEDDPAIHCDPGGPVRFWINVNEPFEIKREEGRVVVDNRFMDSRRVVHLNAAADAAPAHAPRGASSADTPRGTMGHSTGRFEDDALVVSTDHFTAGTIEPRRGIMHTENLKLTERLEVTDEGELEISMTIDDPAFFTEPFTLKELFVRSRLDPEPYNCKPGYQQ
jgi:hypothetical protein